MLSVQSDKSAGYLELTVDGQIGREDFQRAVDAVDALLKTHAKIDVVEVVRNFGWIEPEVWWKDMVFHLSHGAFMRHAAVVSAQGWVGPVTRLFAPLYPAAIRSFKLNELEDARLWAKAHATSKEEDAVPGDFA